MAGWEFLGLTLAQHGIPSDVQEVVTDDYEPDPWRPSPNKDAVSITLELADASRLQGILDAARDLGEIRP